VSDAIRDWPTWAKVVLPLVVVLIVVGLLVAPGKDPAKKKASTVAVKGPGGAYARCAHGIGLTVARRDATHLEARSAKGKVVADTTVFRSPAQAKAFGASLSASDYARGGRIVTVARPKVTGASEAQHILACARKG
jgi:hypothetical protein